jgi:glutamate dehydrogenase (NADP+)
MKHDTTSMNHAPAPAESSKPRATKSTAPSPALGTTDEHFGEADDLHPYAARVLADLSARYWWEKEFLAAVEEVLLSLTPVLEGNPIYESERILERIVEPERVISFRVAWLDDRNQIHVNRGWRVQWSSALGPHKGGTRFHASVTLDGLKFLAFEQTFKNSLTSLPLGSGKGGSDFSPRGKSHHEVMRFCQAYMTELYRHIDPEVDVPAGDIGVGAREIGYLFGHYKRLTHRFNGVFTGKAHEWGGSLLRPEATGFGVAYFAQEMLAARGTSIVGKKVAVSGFGNVAWGLVKKLSELGGKVITLSGPDGYVHDPDGVEGEKVDFLLTMRSSGNDRVQEYAERFGVTFVEGRRPWEVPCDIAFPCAIQNELGLEDAQSLVSGGCRYVVEGANMPTAADAITYLQDQGIVFVPGKAANAGGVAASGLEMSQNGAREYWSAEEVDRRLHQIMSSIHTAVSETAERYATSGDYLAGANICGFQKVAQAMIDQGVG